MLQNIWQPIKTLVSISWLIVFFNNHDAKLCQPFGYNVKMPILQSLSDTTSASVSSLFGAFVLFLIYIKCYGRPLAKACPIILCYDEQVQVDRHCGDIIIFSTIHQWAGNLVIGNRQ